MATTTESRPDRGFGRAMLCGLGGFVAGLLVLGVWGGEMPSPESEGRLLFQCLAPAVVAGLIARGRHWSWACVALVYVITAAVLVLLSALPALK
jgi:hypothetical protein